jgi:hypothetical protein
MTAIVAKLQSARVERAIDIATFALGAASLMLGLMLTVADVASGRDDDLAVVEPALSNQAL